MTPTAKTEAQGKIVTEIGSENYQAVCHFVIEGDYKADHQRDFEGAFAEYEKAWALLETAETRQLLGSDLLDAMLDFAARSGDQELIRRADRLNIVFQQEAQ
ncbi:hypothetical protein [Sphingomonas glacialis]|nr:hypothetical protein [Sphingomonas glacialis]